MLAQTDAFDWRSPLENTFGGGDRLRSEVDPVPGDPPGRSVRRQVDTQDRSPGPNPRINFDSYIDRSGIGAPLERAGFADSGRFLAQIIYYLIVLMVLQMAFNVFGDNPITQALEGLVDWLPKLVVAVALVIIGGMVANVVGDLVAGATAGQSYGGFITRIATIGVWVFFGLAALDQIEIGRDVVDTLTTAIFASLSAILIIKFGVGGIWAARDRFWPNVYDSISGEQQQVPPPQRPQS